MSAQTTLELGAVEAIKRCHRRLRHAAKVVILRGQAQEGCPSMEESEASIAVINALTPILEALTGQEPASSIRAALKRLEADGDITFGATLNANSAAAILIKIAEQG